MLTLHPLFADGAILQCEKPVRICGTASAGAAILVHFAGVTAGTRADADERWSVPLPPLPPGGPHELVVESAGECLRRTDLLLGEVWLCAGQSNMEWTLGSVTAPEADPAAIDDPELRFLTVARVSADEPSDRMAGRWQRATPPHARELSAVAYFFARRLRAETGRPVGLLVAAFGGTAIASWLPATALARRTEYRALDSESPSGNAGAPTSFTPHRYEPRTPVADGWESTELDDSSWSTLPVPGYWQDHEWRHNGAVWYRRAVELPRHWVGRELILELGACDDFDETFVNGSRVGGIGPEEPNAYATRRVYPVPGARVTQPRLTIAVRVFDHWGNGGITGGAVLRLVGSDGEQFDLAGPWRARVEKALPLRAPTSGMPPAVLYNGMIHPLGDWALRGFLWYQGESDVSRAALYRLLLPDLIGAWRSRWGDPRLPFGIVQLANFQLPAPAPVESDWAELRDAQLLAARTVPHTGLVVTIDVGEAANIHPNRKRPVGERLARWALATVYGRVEAPWSSPLPADHWTEAGAVHVRFTHAGTGLRGRDGGPLRGFQIAGADRRWQWADATVFEPDVVRVHAADLSGPVAVRYAWQANPDGTLENSAGLPASPFRTDDWPLTTASAASAPAPHSA